jgi:hypothetical protein
MAMRPERPEACRSSPSLLKIAGISRPLNIVSGRRSSRGSRRGLLETLKQPLSRADEWVYVDTRRSRGLPRLKL